MSNQTTNLEQLSPLQRATLALKKLRTRLDAVEQAQSEPIAIVGMGCRFPGGASSPSRFWALLRDGVDAGSEVPADRWDIEAYYDADPNAAGKMYVKHGYFLDRVDTFDASFFGISPREAANMDPQQRLLLEVTVEALERANVPLDQLQGTQTGVYVGLMTTDYAYQTLGVSDYTFDVYAGPGNGLSFPAGRLSYTLGLQGPCLVVATACSSSLVTTHLACQALRNRECDLALAGGVSLMVTAQGHVILSRLQAVSADGRSKTFDASANGFGRGEGCGMVVLKRLSDALADGDTILAQIRGSAINHDGRSGGLTVPNGPAQEKLLQNALATAKVKADEVSYIEAHGTGTSLGDPIEVRALAEVMGADREGPLWVGSVKTNIGHLEAAAGIAGLIKVVLAMQHRQIPPHLHFNEPNPHIPWAQIPIRIPSALTEWASEGPRLAGVSSFGLSGINAHVILEEGPVAPTKQASPDTVEPVAADRPWHLLTLSARDEAALVDLSKQYQGYMQGQPAEALGDICYTAQIGRTDYPHRLSIAAPSIDQMQTKLAAWVSDQRPTGLNHVNQGYVSGDQTAPRVGYLFTGQGSQYAGMGRELYESQPTFRQTLDACAEILRSHLEQPLLSVLYPETETEAALVHQTAYTQPALFALEYALSALWRSWGVEPEVVLGHSVGEYVAACVAGVFSLEEGLGLITARGRLMQALPGGGSMVAVGASEDQVAEMLAGYEGSVSLAAINGAERVVISGEREGVAEIVARLAEMGVQSRTLQVSHAFHSPLMEPMLAEFERVAGAVSYREPEIGLVSNVSGKLVQREVTEPGYWVGHVMQPVRFAAGVKHLVESGVEVVLELGPQPTLLSLGRAELGDELGVSWLPSLRRKQSDWAVMLGSLGGLYCRGVALDWAGYEAGYRRRKVVLPAYPFQHQRYWADNLQKTRRLESLRPLIDKRIKSPLHNATIFETAFSATALPFLADHRVYDTVVSPGACQLAMVVSSADLAFGSSACQLEDGLLPEALILPDDVSRTVQVVLTPPDVNGVETGTHFQLISFDPENEAEKPATHATGRLLPWAGERPASLSLSELQARCALSIDVAAIYESAAAQQIILGPCFQWLAALWQGDGEALATLRSPDAVTGAVGNISEYGLHPGLLDACFQVAGATIAADEGDEAKLPFAIRRLRLYQAVQGQTWWCHAQQVDTDEWTIHLLDEHGQILLEIEGFEVRTAPRAALQAGQLRRDWLYHLAWQPKPISPLLEEDSVEKEAGPWFIFAASQKLGEALTRELSEQGRQVVFVTAGDRYGPAPSDAFNTVTVNPQSRTDFERLFADYATETGCEQVVYLWGADYDDHDNHEGEQSQQAPQATVEVSSGLLHLVQHLNQADMTPHLWIVTQGSQIIEAQTTKIMSEEAHSEPVDAGAMAMQGALWGLGRTIMREAPQLQCTCLDLDDTTGGESASTLAAALLTGDGESQIAYRHGERYVARLAPSLPGESRTGPDQPLIREDAGYLITGGLGDLGLQVAQQLVEAGAKHLLLTGRRGVTTELARTTIAQLEASGVTVQVVQADVADEQDVKRLLAACEAGAPLRGIVHAAGVIDDALLEQQSLARFATVMQPKVYGAWHLHTLTQAMPLDFFVCFSSAVSILGSLGQSNYAAANAFMDTLMQQRRQMGLPGVSINWGPWAEVGMAANLAHQIHTRGIGEISPRQGRLLFAHLLNPPAAQIGVFPINWKQFLAQVSDDRAGRLYAAFAAFTSTTAPADQRQQPAPPALQHRLAEAAARDRDQVLVDHLQQELSGILELHQPPSLQQGFMDLGMDSLMAVELRNRLQVALGIPLASTLIFKFPTIRELVEHLLSQLTFEESEVAEEEEWLPDNVEAIVSPDMIEQAEVTSDEDAETIARQFAEQLDIEWESLDE